MYNDNPYLLQDGGKVIYTNNPNDPRLKMYNDSLDLYNRLDYFSNIGEFTPLIKGRTRGRYFDQYLEDGFNAPIGARYSRDINGNIILEFPVYKKPTQPVIYKPKPNIPLESLDRKDAVSTPVPQNLEKVPSVTFTPSKEPTWYRRTGFGGVIPANTKLANESTWRGEPFQMDEQGNILQDGGNIQQQGYKDNSPYKNNPYIDIYSNNITMDGVSQPLLVTSDSGEQRVLPPNSGTHYFPNTNVVREEPLSGLTIIQRGNKKVLDFFG